MPEVDTVPLLFLLKCSLKPSKSEETCVGQVRHEYDNPYQKRERAISVGFSETPQNENRQQIRRQTTPSTKPTFEIKCILRKRFSGNRLLAQNMGSAARI